MVLFKIDWCITKLFLRLNRRSKYTPVYKILPLVVGYTSVLTVRRAIRVAKLKVGSA